MIRTQKNETYGAPAMSRVNTKAWITACVSHWSRLVPETEVGVDWADAHDRCWRCGSKRSLQRCHIVARQFSGADDYSNIVPLCAECHDEAPDVTDASEIWRWIKETKPTCYETLKAERALAICKNRGVNIENFDVQKFKSAMDGVGLHLMQNRTGCRIKSSSVAWAIEQACIVEAKDGI